MTTSTQHGDLMAKRKKTWREYTSEAAAAPGDFITAGFTSKIREKLNDDVDPVDKESKTYKRTQLGTALASLVTGAGAARSITSLGAKGVAKTAAKKKATKSASKPIKPVSVEARAKALAKGLKVNDKARQLAKGAQQQAKQNQKRSDKRPATADTHKQRAQRNQDQRLSTPSKTTAPKTRKTPNRPAPKPTKKQSFAAFKSRMNQR